MCSGTRGFKFYVKLRVNRLIHPKEEEIKHCFTWSPITCAALLYLLFSSLREIEKFHRIVNIKSIKSDVMLTLATAIVRSAT